MNFPTRTFLSGREKVIVNPIVAGEAKQKQLPRKDNAWWGMGEFTITRAVPAAMSGARTFG
jgi:hypothetical protein